MPKNRPYYRSRLLKKEEVRNVRRAVFLGFLTFLLIGLVFYFGLPAVIKLAVFLGEIKSSSTPVESKDSTPPPPPQFFSLPEATNKKEINLEGYAEPQSSVEILVNLVSQKTVIADQDGKFSATIQLDSSKNEITATATDQANNKSQASETTSILYDNEPPSLEIAQPQTEETTSNKSPTTISGKTEPETTLTINERIAILDQNGNFSYSFALSEGDNEVKIVAQDLAENKTEKTLKIKYQP